jgi:hypothetical protein
MKMNRRDAEVLKNQFEMNVSCDFCFISASLHLCGKIKP